MNFPRYIAIEGPIGVGKTTLTRMLAERLGAKSVFEEFSDNPFLRDFYADRERMAFQTQTYFLVARYKQQEALRQHDLFARGIVSDYLFAKDRIFAYLNLDEEELSLYEKIYELLRPRLVKPDLVVYLQARPEVLLKRIKMRGRDMESPIDSAYLERLMRAYNQFFFHYEETPLLVVETSDIDFKADRLQLDSMVEQIRRAKAGTLYFVPQA